MTRSLSFAAVLAILAAPVADWPFPGFGVAVDEPSATATQVVRLPGSRIAFHNSDLEGMTSAIDWFPDTHPPAPRVVLRARRKGSFACGYCHLPDGRGRPENASLQGLPADYIVEQVKAFASGARTAASPDYGPTRYMASVARAISPADLNAAAAYSASSNPNRTHRSLRQRRFLALKHGISSTASTARGKRRLVSASLRDQSTANASS